MPPATGVIGGSIGCNAAVENFRIVRNVSGAFQASVIPDVDPGSMSKTSEGFWRFQNGFRLMTWIPGQAANDGQAAEQG